MNDNINILLVDDVSLVKDELINNLRKIGVKANVDFRMPKFDQSIIDELPKGDELNNYDLALIDLELYPLRQSVEYLPEDLAGGTEVLPYLRKVAPWLPIIAMSRLYSEAAKSFFAIAGSYGFDGQLPRHIVVSSSFSRTLWDYLITRAKILRKNSILGYSFKHPNVLLKPIINPDTKLILDKKFPTWESICQQIFYFGDKYSASPIGEGFSGAMTLKTKVTEKTISETTESLWLLKISQNPQKAHEEVQSHLAFMRSGFEYARTVPLLWPGVIVENGIAAIAYQFAEATEVAYDKVNNFESTNKVCGELKTLFHSLYNNEKISKDDSVVSNIISDWFSMDIVKESIKLIPSVTINKIGLKFKKGTNHNFLSEIVSYQRCWLHGDMHLRNILMGKRNVLIDFARSKPGPIVIDLAKFSTDLLLKITEFQEDTFPSWGTECLLNRAIKPISSIIILHEDDVKLYNLFLILYLVVALTYKDITPTSKKYIKNIIKSYVNNND